MQRATRELYVCGANTYVLDIQIERVYDVGWIERERVSELLLDGRELCMLREKERAQLPACMSASSPDMSRVTYCGGVGVRARATVAGATYRVG